VRTVAIDTNVLLTFRLKRGKEFAIINKHFGECSEGKIKIYIPLPVLLETEWVLRSFYRQQKDKIVSFFEELLALENLSVPNKPEVQLVVNLYKHSKGVSFTDSLIVTQIRNQKVDEFLTFDNRLSRLYQTLP